jgi:hypothetical protein
MTLSANLVPTFFNASNFHPSHEQAVINSASLQAGVFFVLGAKFVI